MASFDLDLTGFSLDEIAGLSLAGEKAPDDPPPPLTGQYAVIVMCESGAEQERAFADLQARGYKCKVVCT